jgi:thiol:disulfide interchange protein
MQILGTLGVALLGGLILNVMPCVLPVLTLKAFTLVDHAHSEAAEQRKHGLAYMVGTVSAFLVFGVGIALLRASGKSLGWGMQFQNPAFVGGVASVVFAFALNALGVFEITLSASGSGDDRGGLLGSVANGWFAAIMATPCSAPFLGTAAAFALAADTPTWLTLAIFGCIGIGLAAPFTLLAFVPQISRLLPKPGQWMETFKYLMGFTLLATVVWLYGVLLRQVSPESATLFLGFLLALAVSLWAIGRFGSLIESTSRRVVVHVLAIAVVGLAWHRLAQFEKPAMAAVTAIASTERVGLVAASEPVVVAGKIAWTAFDPKRVDAELARKRPVFMDFTADWCASCKTNEKVFLETDLVRGALTKTNILPMKVDMTNEDDVQSEWLKKLGRNGIPAYVIWLPDGTRDLLPEVITAEMVSERLAAAAARFPAVK